MEYFTEQNNYDKFSNVYGLYVNNPQRTGCLIYMGNKKDETKTDWNEDISYYLNLMSSLVSDYIKGNYQNIPVKTILCLISTLYAFMAPKKSVIDKIPGVRLYKKLGLLTMVIRSFKNDLINYEIWRNNQNKIQEV